MSRETPEHDIQVGGCERCGSLDCMCKAASPPAALVEKAQAITAKYAPGEHGLTNHLVQVFQELASPPAAETGRLVEEALRLLIEATRYNRADRIYEMNPETYRAIEDNLRRARVSGQPVGEGLKAQVQALPPVILFGVAYVSRDDVLKALEAR